MIVKIGPNFDDKSYFVQIYQVDLKIVIIGSVVDEAINDFVFRDEKLHVQDFGTDYYQLTTEELDYLVSMCCGFTVEDYDSNEILQEITGNKNSFSELSKLIRSNS